MIRFTAPDLTAPDSSIIGVIEEGVPGLCSPLGRQNEIPVMPGDYILDHVLARADSVSKSKALAHMVRLRRSGATIVLISHDEALLESCADEIWWIRRGELAARGDPSEVLAAYRLHVADVLRNSGAGELPRLSPTMRNGDGRAVLEQIELFGENDESSTVFRSGEVMAVRVTIRFAARVEDPVVGIMIRTRIGLNVYGTNTELERLTLGPVEAGESLQVTYSFRCDLCPGEYTVTAASHDPDGVWHDWMEDAVAFTVSDTRYTAGVANLHARVEYTRR